MSSAPCMMIPCSRDFVNEQNWVLEISKNLDEGLEEEAEIPVSIFIVPKVLLASSPASYLPQEIAIGPYHYFSPELYEMEKYKIVAAKKLQKQLGDRSFQYDVVDEIKGHELRIRAHYHKYLPISGETLAWIMAMDACFLLEFLQVYAEKDCNCKTFTRVTSRMSHLLDSASTNSAHSAILRDMVMLENQIPLFILGKVLDFQSPLSEIYGDKLLLSMVMGFSLNLSPFKTMEKLTCIQVSECAHLLDFLYKLVVPESIQSSEIVVLVDEHGDQVEEGEGKSDWKSNNKVMKFLRVVWNFLVKSEKGPVRIIFLKPLKVLVKSPWQQIISNFPVLRIMKQPIESLFSNQETKQKENESSKRRGKIDERAPSVEEIIIPSVTKLSRSGVQFVPTNNGISSIKFDVKTHTFHLPTLFLDVNTEVVLRNLVAYEACSTSKPLVFTRYTELMNGIIDSNKDAEFLREKGIIVNLLKSDNEVANLWNGMSNSIKLTKVDFIDKAIADVNKFYNGRWKTKAIRFFEVYVLRCWQLLTLVAALLMLVLMALQDVCDVYDCPRFFHYIPNMPN